MKYILSIVFVLFAFATFGFTKPRVLIFSKTAVFHHESIAVGVPAIIKLGQQNNFDVDTTTNSALFTLGNLKKYKAVIFLSTTGDVLNPEQQTAFEQYIKQGGGYLGVHSATDTEYDWPWYGNLVGAYFKNHPEKQQEANLKIVDRNFIATKGLPATWRRLDEWYNFKWIAKRLHVVIKIDEKSYTGGENGSNHPMAWYHNYDGGRAFYTALGHTDASYSEPLFLKHLLGGIKYAIGQK
ncbi:MAG: ThuA domain-containing protein [Mucilaginibacter sp.]|nr:ThuA domain-containing protein [Mucilaginibacter sp.]